MIVASFLAPRFEKWPGVNYLDCLAVLQSSCDRLGLRHVVISDRKLPRFETARYELPENLMQACLEGQRRFLMDAGQPVLLVGADCILTRDPRSMVEDCDMAVTVHAFNDCVLNTGAIACFNARKCAPIWEKALAHHPVEWGDDQKALKAALDPVTATPMIGTRQGLVVRFLPCRTTNWAPEGPADDAGMPLVVHFRGNRKPWMKPWYDRFIAAQAAA